jgi:hypothetical protein
MSLRGQRLSEARAAEAAGQMILASAGTPATTARALFEALTAGPDTLAALADLHQAQRAYDPHRLRGASAAAAALLRWSA